MKKIVIIAGIGLIVIIGTVVVVKAVNRSTSGSESTAVTGAVNDKKSSELGSTSKQPAGNYDKTASAQLTGRECSGVGSVPIIPPMKLDQVSSILPYGLMTGGHVTPIDHQYYNGLDIHALRDTYDVVAPADATIYSIQHRGSKTNTPLHSVDVPSSDEYRLVFVHTCSFLTYVDLVTSLDPAFIAKLPKDWTPNYQGPGVAVKVKQGEVIGHIGGQTLDFAVWDLSQKPLAGLLVRSAYDNAEVWKVFTAPTTTYLKPDIKAATIAKYVRTREPIDGKLDYDVAGKLIGTWFQAGTNGYDGGRVSDPSRQDYWRGHLALAPNFIDPSVYTFSLGKFTNATNPPASNPDAGSVESSGAQQFGIASNAADPAKVDISTGLVKYDLFKQHIHTASGAEWHGEVASGIKATNAATPMGVILVQMLETHKLKVEIFPGKTATSVSGFDENALIYNRGDDAKLTPSTAH